MTNPTHKVTIAKISPYDGATLFRGTFKQCLTWLEEKDKFRSSTWQLTKSILNPVPHKIERV